MENLGFARLKLETQNMDSKQFDAWLKQLSLDELDDIVFATEDISKQALQEMGKRSTK